MTGSGTEGDPYIISSKADLQAIEDNLGSYYELGANIDASGTGAGFTPITNFTGQLDGKGYTITGFFINRTSSNSQALFAKISGSAVVQNFIMTSVDVTSDRTYTAALIAYIEGASCTVSDCSSTGTVTASGSVWSEVGGLIGHMEGSTISGCYSTCTVASDEDFAGGLIGYMDDGDIDKCYATGAVSVDDDYAGGFVGRVDAGTINDCYARGAVTVGDDYGGGFTGYNSGATIEDCYSTGLLAVTGSFEGGFVGYDDGDGAITNCFWDTETSGTETDPGGGTGAATGKTTVQMKAKVTFTDAGWDFATIWAVSGTNNGYPAFTASGELAGVYAIVEKRFHYVDAYGQERYIQGTAV